MRVLDTGPGYGVSNLERRTPVTAKTVFAIASVSKQFLAAGAMVLVQEGKLSLDDSVAPYLTDATPNWRPITIRELLTHTSGLPGDVPGFRASQTLDAAEFQTATVGDQWQTDWRDVLGARPGLGSDLNA